MQRYHITLTYPFLSTLPPQLQIDTRQSIDWVGEGSKHGSEKTETELSIFLFPLLLIDVHHATMVEGRRSNKTTISI